jgi:uncharacterized protein YceH (UPF0502 family)
VLEQTAELTLEEQRVLGCLIEKEATTPDQYPLSMNALILACNQSTNRDPVVSLDEEAVTAALGSLREKGLIRIVYPAHARVTKYRHVLGEVWALTAQELAVIAVLLLRGPQTVNELKTRTDRYASFDDLGGIEGVLDRLAGRPEPLVNDLGRQPGQREGRFGHLLGRDFSLSVSPPQPGMSPPPAPGRLDTLEAGLEQLQSEVKELREQVDRLLGKG